MRQIGVLSNPKLADRFCDYLLTEGIEYTSETSADGVSIWVHDEDLVDRARADFARYNENPEAAEFVEASKLSRNVIRKKFVEKTQERPSNREHPWRVSRPAASRFRLGRSPVSRVLIYVSILIALISNFGKKDSVADVFRFGTVQQLASGEIWRIASPMFLHFNGFHLLFNLAWIYSLGRDIELKIGPLRFAGLVILVSIAANVAQGWQYNFDTGRFDFADNFGGMSGVVYGLFGFAVALQHFAPQAGFRLGGNLIQIMIFWFVLCWTGWVGTIANMAHTGGLIAGAFIGWLASERINRKQIYGR